MSGTWEPLKTAFDRASPHAGQMPAENGPPPPVPDAQALTAIVRALINSIPQAAGGSNDEVQRLLGFARAAAQAIKDGNLDVADVRIDDLRRELAVAEAARIKKPSPPPRSLPPAPGPAIPPVVAPSNLNASPESAVSAVQSAVPAAQQAVPAVQPAAEAIPAAQSAAQVDQQEVPAVQPAAQAIPAAQSAAQVDQQAAAAAQLPAPAVRPMAAQPAAQVAHPWDAARTGAENEIAVLRKLLDKAVEFEPYLSDQLTSQMTKVANILEKRLSGVDGDELADAARIRAYQAVAADARTVASGFDKQIRIAVAAQRKTTYDALATDEKKKAWLGQLAASRDGRQTMDDMVASLGGTAKTDQDKQFVKEALKARYKIDELAGDMSTKALPKFYELLGMVPEAHTTGNNSLKKITRNSRVMAMFEGSHYDHISKGIVINLPKSCLLFSIPLPFYRMTAAGERNWSDGFSFATLHEIGHSVDDKLGFMIGKEGNPTYGGWVTESADTIAGKAGELKGFYSAFQVFPKRVLKRFLTAVLSTGKPPDPVEFIQTAQSEANGIESKLQALNSADQSRGLQKIDRERQGLVDRGANEAEWAEAYKTYAGKTRQNPTVVIHLS